MGIYITVKYQENIAKENKTILLINHARKESKYEKTKQSNRNINMEIQGVTKVGLQVSGL